MKLRRKCSCCGTIKDVGTEIRWIDCPYADEIRDDWTKMWHCDSCDHECYMDT